jgi:hypothetical protein
MSKAVLVASLVLFASPAFGQDVIMYHVKHITVLAEDRHVRVLLRPPVTHADEALDDVEAILIELKK